MTESGSGRGAWSQHLAWLLHANDDARLTALRRAQMRRVWACLAWLIVVALAAVLFVPATAPRWLRIVVALAGAPPIIALGALRMQLVATLDELQRRVEHRAMAVAFMLALCCLLTLALLRALNIRVDVPPLVLFWLLFGTWVVAGRWFRAHYQ